MVGYRNDVTIHTLRLRRLAGMPAVAEARLPAERMLGGADLCPPEMPPGAILLVQRFQDPQPGKMAADTGAASVNQEWERSARQALGDLYRQAARPVRGEPVSASANAVCFSGEGEALVCLLLDLRQGNAAGHWWWQALIKSPPFGPGRSLKNEQTGFSGLVEAAVSWMSRRAELAPAALAWLEQRGQAEAVLQLFDDGQAERLLQAVLAAYQLPALVKTGKFDWAMMKAISAGAKADSSQNELLPSESIHSARDAFSLNQVSFPLRRGFSHLDTLGRTRAALLGLSLDLVDHLNAVRSAFYGRRLIEWWLAPTGATPSGAGTPPREHGLGDSPLERLGHASPETNAESSIAKAALENRSPETPPGEGGIVPEFSAQTSQVQPQQLETMGLINPEVAASSANEGKSQSFEEQPPLLPSRHTIDHLKNKKSFNPANVRPEEQHPHEKNLPGQSSFSWLAITVDTQLGGVLYLVNLMRHLGLPERFERGWRIASGVGAWGTLDALARTLLGEQCASLQTDPIWAALAQLDRRQPGQLPGFRLPRARPRRWPDFQLPEDWVRGVQELTLSAVQASPQENMLFSSGRPLLDRWLSLAVPAIKARLLLALSLDDPDEIGETLLRVPGRIYISSSHIDLATSLQNISLRVRRAGLDRDPGWAPNFGWVIYFHFDS